MNTSFVWVSKSREGDNEKSCIWHSKSYAGVKKSYLGVRKTYAGVCKSHIEYNNPNEVHINADTTYFTIRDTEDVDVSGIM